MDKKQVTIKDIAKKLNLHHTTVSRALRDHPKIKPATKELVLSLAEELDYLPNIIAQNLKTRKSRTIGMIVPSIRNDFFAKVISGVEDEVHTSGYSITVRQSNDNYEREVINIRAMVSSAVAGILISVSKDTRTGQRFEIFQKRDIPLVFFDRVCKGIPAGYVMVDDFNGAFKAVSHLIDSGYRRIAHLAGPTPISVSQNRLKGYLAALKKSKIAVNEDLIIYGGFEEEDGVAGAKQLFSRPASPDAIFSVNDLAAIGAYQIIKEKGMKIPDDIGMAGFGDNILSRFLDPPLTTVGQSPYDIGKISAKMILDQIEGRVKPADRVEHVLKTELIVRKSSIKS